MVAPSRVSTRRASRSPRLRITARMTRRCLLPRSGIPTGERASAYAAAGGRYLEWRPRRSLSRLFCLGDYLEAGDQPTALSPRA
jgi:hypothetical protein